MQMACVSVQCCGCLQILKNVKTASEVRNSVCHSAVIYANAIMHSGTTVDSFLRENLDWLSRATNWAKFSATAGLGVIHRGHLSQVCFTSVEIKAYNTCCVCVARTMVECKAALLTIHVFCTEHVNLHLIQWQSVQNIGVFIIGLCKKCS